MKKVKQWKNRWRSQAALLLAAAVLGATLSGCGASGTKDTAKTEAATEESASGMESATEPETASGAESASEQETAGAESATEQEPASDMESASEATEAGADAKPADGQETLLLEYNSGGDTPTITTVTFDLNKGTVEVSALASSMYELSYETTYSVADHKLVIETVAEITATDISGVAKVIGLPETMTGNAVHSVSDSNPAVLTIQFGEPEKLDEAALLGEIELDDTVLAQLGV